MNNRRLPLPDPNANANEPNIKLVWLLNLIPYLGVGYLYAVGLKGFKVMLFFWIFELMFGSPMHLIWIYFILSVLGSAHIINKDRSTAIKLRQVDFNKEIDSVEPGTQIPMGESSQYSLSTLEMKARKAEQVLKRLYGNEDAKSESATETFEYKALAAEKTLQARDSQSKDAESNDAESQAAINFAPPDAPTFSTEEPRTGADPFLAPSAVPESTLSKADDGRSNKPHGSAEPPGSFDYSSHMNNSFMDSVVSDATSAVTLGASTGSLEVQQLLNQEDAANAADLKIAQTGASLNSSVMDEAAVKDLLKQSDDSTDLAGAPFLVPEVSGEITPSDSYVPYVSSQYSSDPVSLPNQDSKPMTLGISVPEVSSQWNNADTSVPEVSSQWNNADATVPEVSTQWNTAETSVPEVSTQLQNAETSVPEVNMQLQNAETIVPDLSSQWNNAETSVPEVSSQWNNADASVPEVSTQWNNADASVPEVSAQWKNADTSVPDVASQLAKSDQTIPDVNSQLAPSSSNVPSLGEFVSPKFSFSFEDHLNTSFLPADPAAPSATTDMNCPKCGALKNSSFSFCLACGQTFE